MFKVNRGTDGTGGTTKPVSDVLLPSLFRAKIQHPTYDTWKKNSETRIEVQKNIQVSFLTVVDQTASNHDQSNKFRASNQQFKTSEGLTANENKQFQQALGKENYTSKVMF